MPRAKNIRTDDNLKDRPLRWIAKSHTLWQGSFVHKGITYTIKFIGGRGGRWDVVFEARIPIGGVVKIGGILYSAFHQFIHEEAPKIINLAKVKSKKAKDLMQGLIKKVKREKPQPKQKAKKTKPPTKKNVIKKRKRR